MSLVKLLIDIGSTFTKATAVDIESPALLATAKSPTTVKDDVTIGLQKALTMLSEQIGSVEGCEVIACSSAAGGLRMVSIGLVQELSSEAAKRAALGAGAKIIGHYSHQLTRREIRQIEDSLPDLILLAGGTDGGNEDVIVHNAGILAGSNIRAAIVVAGNKSAYDRIEDVFEGSSKVVRYVDNVMPEIGKLEVQPCREAIREVFMERIVKAKGLSKAKELVGHVIMPTPAAVLNGAVTLANGAEGLPGLGELIVVDVGGATTDIYSIAKGTPTKQATFMKGLPEPFAKRTVEGDLGVRHNIETIVEICSHQGIPVDHEVIAAFQADASKTPSNERKSRRYLTCSHCRRNILRKTRRQDRNGLWCPRRNACSNRKGLKRRLHCHWYRWSSHLFCSRFRNPQRCSRQFTNRQPTQTKKVRFLS